MKGKTWPFLVVALAGVLILLAVGCTGPAGPVGPEGKAAESPPTSIVIVPASGLPGASLVAYGSGFVPGEKVRVILRMGETDMAWGPVGSGGFAVVNDYGAFKLIPQGGIPAASLIKPGVYPVEAMGDKGSRASTPLVVLAPPPPKP